MPAYETVTLDSLVSGVLRRDGLTPADVGDDDQLALVQFIADRLEAAWQWYRWPVLLTIEGRHYRDDWSAGSYAEDDIVWHAASELYYRATTATSGVPGVSTDWEEAGDFYRYVAWEQTGETAIRACLRAWDKDPRENTDALEIPFEVCPDGIRFAPDAPDSPFLEIQGRCPDFHAEAYSASATYAVGDRIWFTDGEVWEVVSATSAGQTPVTHPAKYSVLTLPRFLANALRAGAYADWLANNDQHAKAAVWEPRFTELLDEEVWQLTKLQGQTGRARLIPSGRN